MFTCRSTRLAVLTVLLGALTFGPALVHGANAPTAHAAVVKRVFNPARLETKLPPHWLIAGRSYMSLQEYRDLRNGCMEILRRYPPDKYYFVGLGRDPAPVIAFLQNLGGKELAVNLPGTSNIQWAKSGLKPEDVARHIEAAIPQHILVGKRQIVVLDVTSSGKTPAIFGPFIDKYLRQHGNRNKVVRLALSWNNIPRNSYYRAPKYRLEWIDTTAWSDFNNYNTGKYEGHWRPGIGGFGIAQHQRHVMGPGVNPPTKTNPNYRAFKKALLARMEQDRKLDRFLKTIATQAN